jgi:sulfoxide reductase heme-binding subunit YedZ
MRDAGAPRAGYLGGPAGEPAATMNAILPPGPSAAAVTTATTTPMASAPAARRTGPSPRRAGRGIPWPWLDRAGRFSPLKASVLLLSLLPGAALAWLLATGQMGAEPYKQAAREAGVITIRMLLVTLAVTPLRVLADWPRVVLVRRMLGLVTLGYALVHLGLYAAHLNGDLLKLAGEIARRVYLTIGFAALAGLAVLGVTSTDAWIRRLGRRWKTLHRLVFAIAALGLVHFFLQSKADVTGPTLTAGLFLWLLLWRSLPAEMRGGAFGLLALVPVAVVATAAVEFGWYAFATNLPAHRVLMANFDLALGPPRPAVAVGLVALAAALLPAAVRTARRVLPGRR